MNKVGARRPGDIPTISEKCDCTATNKKDLETLKQLKHAKIEK